jgi:hypothetical protein
MAIVSGAPSSDEAEAGTPPTTAFEIEDSKITERQPDQHQYLDRHV